ncbi:LppU/SCO3897 family protein [Amycolatopsis echigonensis]|uniref:LppU/SCO3897 family protein n=1 Tax=Amycolatopsis echigonensis TaxID=2576905 RepID=UPI001FE40140|nr:hypothetical protein [Amycolatopsis echigonensis]
MTTPPFGMPPIANPYQPPPRQPVQRGPKRVSGKLKALFAALVVVALGLGTLGAFGFAAIARSAGPPVVGSCLYLSSLGSETQTYTGADCSDQAATFRVDAVSNGRSSCRGEDYVRFELYTSARSTSKPSETLCLALNVVSGECVRDVSDESKGRQGRVRRPQGGSTRCGAQRHAVGVELRRQGRVAGLCGAAGADDLPAADRGEHLAPTRRSGASPPRRGGWRAVRSCA